LLKSKVFQIPTERRYFAEPWSPEATLVDDLPAVPALSQTLLLMELKLHEFSIDLHEISQLVLGDPGATLQILRLAAHEYGAADGRPVRIEDCISDFGLDACLRAAGQTAPHSNTYQRCIFEAWSHSLQIAQGCKSLAGTTAGWINPDDAWLVGLVHMLGQMPGILGWQWDGGSKGWAEQGLRLAEHWRLPLCVQEFFAEMLQSRTEARWAGLVRRAHALVPRSMQCPLCDKPGLQLHRRA